MTAWLSSSHWLRWDHRKAKDKGMTHEPTSQGDSKARLFSYTRPLLRISKFRWLRQTSNECTRCLAPFAFMRYLPRTYSPKTLFWRSFWITSHFSKWRDESEQQTNIHSGMQQLCRSIPTMEELSSYSCSSGLNDKTIFPASCLKVSHTA
jgi:hypothetical protein